jgi:hypothetical protein
MQIDGFMSCKIYACYVCVCVFVFSAFDLFIRTQDKQAHVEDVYIYMFNA